MRRRWPLKPDLTNGHWGRRTWLSDQGVAIGKDQLGEGWV